MWNAIAALIGLRELDLADAGPRSQVPEPEFEPFDLSKVHAPEAGRAAVRAAVNTTQDPRTLRELGVPGPLAAEMETMFRVMGLVEGDRVVSFTFRTPDGATYALRTGSAAHDASVGRAA